MHLFLSTSLLFASLTISFVQGYNRIIAFADSYTDNGNHYRHTHIPPLPYWKGRFSNGPTWLEQVAQELDGVQVINNAYGGATADNAYAYSEDNGYVVPGMIQQIEQFPVPDPNPDNDLYIIYIGYNDLNALLRPNMYKIVKAYTYNDVSGSVVDGIHRLVQKYNASTFIVMTLGPFDQWPAYNATNQLRAKQLIHDYNASLESKVKAIQKEKKNRTLSVSILDDHAWFENALAHPERFGVETSDGGCLSLNESTNQFIACDDPSKHFFWDDFHPSAKIHKALGQWATKKLKEKYHF